MSGPERDAAKYRAPARSCASATHRSTTTRFSSGMPDLRYNCATPTACPSPPNKRMMPSALSIFGMMLGRHAAPRDAARLAESVFVVELLWLSSPAHHAAQAAQLNPPDALRPF